MNVNVDVDVDADADVPCVKDLVAGITAAGDAATEKRATAASHAKATARLAKAIEEGTAERAKLTEDVKTIKEEFKTLEDGAMEVGWCALNSFDP